MLGEAGGGGVLELLYIIQLAKGRSQGGGLKNYSIKFRCCMGGGDIYQCDEKFAKKLPQIHALYPLC